MNKFKLELEIVSIRFSIRPLIAIRSGSKQKISDRDQKNFNRDPTFSDFYRQLKFRWRGNVTLTACNGMSKFVTSRHASVTSRHASVT